MMRIRLAILGPSPCHLCMAACCKQNGHAYAALLDGEERVRFAPWAERVVFESPRGPVMEHVLPYRDGRCVFLGEDDRCTVYEDRPQSCRLFECIRFYRSEGGGNKHGDFLKRNPGVLVMLERM